MSNIRDTEYPPFDHIPTVFHMETSGTHRVAPPDNYVDISEEFEQKLEAYRQHKSQVGDFLQKQFSIEDCFERQKVIAKLRDSQCGCKYVEAFRILQTWPNHKAYCLLPPVQYRSW